jgi:hypothetical protein
MGTSYTTTSTYSNLTRLELEQLRRADFWTGGKALTVGDSAYGAEGVVGKGNVNAEPYYTGPETPLDAVFTNTPPQRPGIGLSTSTQVSGLLSETVSWVGPEYLWDSDIGYVVDIDTWGDDTPGLNFNLWVQVGDILLVKGLSTDGTGANAWAVGSVSWVGTNQLMVDNVVCPNGATPGVLDVSGVGEYNYVVIRPSAAQLFAVPGSGPTGREQTFMMVTPGSVLHSTAGPTLNQINADRIQNIVPASYTGSTTIDRADSVYNSPAPRTSLEYLGYRVVLYPDNGSGTGPDLTKPISTLNPIIDSTLPAADQRMTLDLQAGVVRFSCAPRVGDQIKPVAGCVNAATGRLNLYAVYWAVDTSLTKGNARGLWATRSNEFSIKTPAKVDFDQTNNCWRLHSATDGQYFYTRTLDIGETGAATTTEFGAYDPATAGFRYFIWRQDGVNWKFVRSDGQYYDPPTSKELDVADKTALTVGDGANPAQGIGGDAMVYSSYSVTGFRKTREVIMQLMYDAVASGYGIVHLRKGRYLFDQPLHIPPGVTLEGEGAGTVLEKFTNAYPGAVIKFGPNTPWGVYDYTWIETSAKTSPAQIYFTDPLLYTEGLDIVWNPTKRVWGVTWADCASQEIFFNEMRADGTFVHNGYGFPLKSSVTSLFTSASTGGENHTAGHYPRLAYHPHQDLYGVVWVEANASSGYPQVRVKRFRILTDGTEQVYTLTTIGTSAQKTDHPSIAFNLHSPTDITAYVSCAMFFAGTTRIQIHAVGAYATTVYETALGATRIVSSTDICVNTDEQPLACVCMRCLRGQRDLSTAASPTSSTTTRPSTSPRWAWGLVRSSTTSTTWLGTPLADTMGSCTPWQVPMLRSSGRTARSLSSQL